MKKEKSRPNTTNSTVPIHLCRSPTTRMTTPYFTYGWLFQSLCYPLSSLHRAVEASLSSRKSDSVWMMFGACSVLLRMNKSAQVGGAQAKRSTAQTQHDRIGGRNDVDDILFAYGVVTRRLPSSCIHTEHGVYLPGDRYRTDCFVQTAASRSSERQKPIYYNTTRGRRICTIASWLTGLKDRIWMIAFAWIGLVPFPACSDIRAIQEGGEWMDGWSYERSGGKEKVKKKKKSEKKKKNILLNSRKRLKLSWCDKTSGPGESKRLLLACSGG